MKEETNQHDHAERKETVKNRSYSLPFRIKVILVAVVLPLLLFAKIFIKAPQQFGASSFLPAFQQTNIDRKNSSDNEWEPCWRQCLSRNNKIIVSNAWKAGLNDRFYIFERFINIAGYLCATLVVPKPVDMLGEWHNNNKPVAPAIQWSDFKVVSWAMNHYKNGTWSNETRPPLRELSLTEIGEYLGRSERNKKPSLYLTTIKREQGWRHFHQLENFTLEQQQEEGNNDYFVWNINKNFYETNLFSGVPENTTMPLSVTGNPRPLSFPNGIPQWQWDGCTYYHYQTPRHIQRIADNIWKEVQSFVHDATIGLFHIRRGDMQHECNTTLPKVEAYVACSFAGSRVLGNITILLSTDETDEQYLRSVTGMMEANPHVKVRSLDELAWKHVRQYVENREAPSRILNNFVVFKVMDIIRFQRVAFTIEQRRVRHCPDCEELVKMDWVQPDRDRIGHVIGS